MKDTMLDYPLPRSGPFLLPQEYAKLREGAPLIRVRLWNDSTAWLVTRYATVRALLADDRLSADPRSTGYPLLGPSREAVDERDNALNHLDPPTHSRFRRLLAGEFTVALMEQMRPALRKLADRSIERMRAQGSAGDLVTEFALPYSADVTCAFLGVPVAEQEFFRRRTSARVDLTTSPDLARRAHREVLDALQQLVDATVEAPCDNLIGRLAHCVVEGHLTRDELIDIARLLLANGLETSASALSLGAAALLSQPGPGLAGMRHLSPEKRRAVVEETLRFATVVHLAPVRAVRTELEVDGILLRPGDGVILSIASANHDPKAFAEAERFCPGRATNRHLAFGHGPHHCLGHTFARIELEVALTAISRGLPEVRLAVDARDLPFRHTSALYGLDALPVVWGPAAR